MNAVAKAHGAYHASMMGHAPDEHELRAQDLSKPLVGDLIKPGMIVETSYGTGPYMVVSTQQYQVYEGYSAWSLNLRKAERDGRFAPGKPDSWVNEVVVAWDGETPRFRRLFVANPDEVTIVQEQAFACTRSGQGVLL